ncbi:hypothetical protein C1645_817518 [Glomus cerebriforme]|uniref:Uncharacterized protein n=1 Tax=Glomus cerebriforme TaxID=658196 RepID=A0A397TEA7_9GLOM|nr:hypothetical protein C1645_817518 [Glomus cerebriforme]
MYLVITVTEEVNDDLNNDLKIMESLEYNYVKFSFHIEPIRNMKLLSFPNAFDIMMRNSQQLKLSQYRIEHTRHDLLYNEIIDLLHNQKYIDPYLKLLQSHACHMPAFFKELATYASDDTNRNTYNLAYYTSHYKKEPILHQKLDLLIKSDKSACNPTNNAYMFCILGCKEDDFDKQYQKLNDAILQCEFYQYMDIYSYLPTDIMKCYQYIKNL